MRAENPHKGQQSETLEAKHLEVISWSSGAAVRHIPVSVRDATFPPDGTYVSGLYTTWSLEQLLCLLLTGMSRVGERAGL